MRGSRSARTMGFLIPIYFHHKFPYILHPSCHMTLYMASQIEPKFDPHYRLTPLHRLSHKDRSPTKHHYFTTCPHDLIRRFLGGRIQQFRDFYSSVETLMMLTLKEKPKTKTKRNPENNKIEIQRNTRNRNKNSK